MKHEIYLMFICLLLLFKNAELYSGPENQAVIQKNNVSLTCRNVEKPSNKNLWQFCKFGTLDPRNVYRNSKLLPNFTRHTVKEHETDKHSHELIIQETNEEDAGLYYCITSAADQYTAHLIILASEPNCQTDIRNAVTRNGILTINKNGIVSMWCEVQFSGNWSPTMTWQLKESTVPLNDSITEYRNTSVISTLKLDINSTIFSEKSAQFTCKTYFAVDNKPKEIRGSKLAPNIPGYTFTWEAPVININSGGFQLTDTKENQYDNKLGSHSGKETGTKTSPGTMTVTISTQTVIFLVAGIGVFVIVIITAAVFKFKANNTKECTIQKNARVETEREDYCDIEENAREQRKPRNSMKVSSGNVVTKKESRIMNELNVGPLNTTDLPFTREDEHMRERIYENRSVIDETPLANRNVDIEDGSIRTQSSVSSRNKGAGNYLHLEPSTRGEQGPPSVYKRLNLKSIRVNQNLGTSINMREVPSADTLSGIAGPGCSSGPRMRPKPPTPESDSSLESVSS